MQATNIINESAEFLDGMSKAASSRAASGLFQEMLSSLSNSVDETVASNDSGTTSGSDGWQDYQATEKAEDTPQLWDSLENLSNNYQTTSSDSTQEAEDDYYIASISSEVSDPKTPIEQFIEKLEEEKGDLERLVVEPEDRQYLQSLLEASGFKSAVASQMLTRATDDEGNVVISKLKDLLEQYEPTEGPLFTISLDERAYLAQFLDEMGMDTSAISEYLDSLPEVDGQIQVRGLGQLLENLSQGGREVDLERLGDFLGRLGMSDSDVDALLTSHTDSNGKMSPSQAAEIFKTVSSIQSAATDSQVTEDIDTLLGRVQVDTPTIENFSETQLKASASENLKESMPDPAPAEDAQGDASAESLTQDVEDKLNANENQGEAGSRSGARSEAVNDSVAETADQDGSETGEQAGRNGNGSQQAMSTANRAQTSTNGSNEQSSEFQQKFESSLGMGTASGSSQTAGTTGTAGSRAAIPTYVVRQVATQISQMVKQGDQVLRLTLKPAELGSMKVELSVEQSVIKASLTVDTVTAKNTLEAGMEQLRQNLAQQGFKVDRIEVSVNTENQDQQQAQSGEQGSGQQNRGSISGVATGSDSEGDIWAQTEDLSVDQAASEQSGISLFA